MQSDAFLNLNFRKKYPEFYMQLQTSFNHGEFFSLVGPSGCGKTTLLRLIAGLEQPDWGSIRLQGKELTGISPAQRRIGLVFQDYALFPHLNVAQNIAYGLKTQHWQPAVCQQRVDQLLKLFELSELANRDIQQLSGGEKQRVAIARALAPKPEVLLLDEPFSALDYRLRRRLQADLKQYQRLLGITTIFVTHQQEEALAISDRIGIMQNGHLLQVGVPAEIYRNPVNRFVAEFLGEVNLLPCEVIQNGQSAEYEVLCGQISFVYRPPSPDCLSSGRYTLMLRPEAFNLSTNDSAAGRGKVIASEFLGAFWRLKLAVSDFELIILTDQAGEKFSIGETVVFDIDQNAVHLLPIDF